MLAKKVPAKMHIYPAVELIASLPPGISKLGECVLLPVNMKPRPIVAVILPPDLKPEICCLHPPRFFVHPTQPPGLFTIILARAGLISAVTVRSGRRKKRIPFGR